MSDEFVFDQAITKFPGGGLIEGEGPIDCLKREMKEETGLEIEIIDHFYTTDFFVPSAFHSDLQVISIYYRMNFLAYKDSLLLHQIQSIESASQVFRLIPLPDLREEDLSLPVDRLVAARLKQVNWNK